MERIGETRNWRRKQTGDPPYLAAKMVHKAGPPLYRELMFLFGMSVMRKLATIVGIGGVLCAGVASAADLSNTQRFDEAFQEPASSSNSVIVSLWGGGVVIQTDDSNFDKDSILTLGGDARGYIELGGGLGVLLELSTIFEDHADDSGSQNQTTVDVTGGVHLISRGGAADYGIFAAVSNTSHNDENDESVHIMGGVEASMFRDMTQYFVQFGGQVAVAGDDDETWEEGIFGSVGARHFYSETSAVLAQATVGGFGEWESGTSGGDGPPIWGQAILEYEQQIGGSGLSGFVGYQGDYIYDLGDPGWGDTLLNHAFKIGLRGNFGAGGTVYSLAKNGAGTFSLPDLHTPFSYTDDLW